jgi:enterobactin synthetase component D
VSGRGHAGTEQVTTIAEAVAALAGDHVGVAVLGPADEPDPLHPAEVEAVAHAVPARARDFALGRTCARRALAAIGLAPRPIPVGEGRRPLWPEGVVGSITHAGGWAVAVVGRSGRFVGLGVDIELDGAVGDEELSVLATAAERRRLEAHAEADVRATTATVVHGAKECVHKVVHPATGVALEPTDADVVIVGHPPATSGRWTAALLRDAGPLPAGTALTGGWATVPPGGAGPAGGLGSPGFVVCVLAVERWTRARDSANISSDW